MKTLKLVGAITFVLLSCVIFISRNSLYHALHGRAVGEEPVQAIAVKTAAPEQLKEKPGADRWLVLNPDDPRDKGVTVLMDLDSPRIINPKNNLRMASFINIEHVPIAIDASNERGDHIVMEYRTVAYGCAPGGKIFAHVVSVTLYDEKLLRQFGANPDHEFNPVTEKTPVEMIEAKALCSIDIGMLRPSSVAMPLAPFVKMNRRYQEGDV